MLSTSRKNITLPLLLIFKQGFRSFPTSLQVVDQCVGARLMICLKYYNYNFQHINYVCGNNQQLNCIFCLADSLTDEVSVELCARSKQYKKQAASAGNKTGKQQQLTKDLFQVA